MRSLTIGKFRGLQRCSDGSGALVILAVDHRSNLRPLLKPQSPDEVTPGELTAFKLDVVHALGREAGAVLLDPQYGAAQAVARAKLPREPGLIVALEATGYAGTRNERVSRILPEWSVAKADRMGADAVRLLVYYHPEVDNAPATESLVDSVAQECQSVDLPLFLAALTYSVDPQIPGLTPEKHTQAVVETARILTAIPGVDVYMSDFPILAGENPDISSWDAACSQLSEASRVPWVLLSPAVDFDRYLQMTGTACRMGASGTAGGRAVWQEAVALAGSRRSAYLQKTARSRFSQLQMTCDSTAVPWTSQYAPPDDTPDWYRQYPAGLANG